MIQAPHTVLVLGAGASNPVGFPTGPELFDRLTDWLLQRGGYNDDLLKMLLAECPHHDVAGAVHALKHTNTVTIDDFLAEPDPAIRRVVKAAAALLLMQQERAFDTQLPRTYNHTWYKTFADRLHQARTRDHGVAIITFNYDRSLESYLYRVEVGRRSVRRDTAVVTAPLVDIVHIHGTLGTTVPTDEWWSRWNDRIEARQAMEAGDRIRLYTEQREREPVAVARRWLAGAGQVVFMGFGFHPQNMRTLAGPGRPLWSTNQRLVYSTCLTNDARFAGHVEDMIGHGLSWFEGADCCRRAIAELPDLCTPDLAAAVAAEDEDDRF